MRSGLKSFVKVMTLPALYGASSIEFNDTAGNILPCNYVSIQCRNASSTGDATNVNETGYFFVAPSAADSTIYEATLQPSSMEGEGGNAKGAGGVAGTADATVEMSFLPPDRATGLTIHSGLGSTARFIITYGNIQGVNPQRDGSLLYPRRH